MYLLVPDSHPHLKVYLTCNRNRIPPQINAVGIGLLDTNTSIALLYCSRVPINPSSLPNRLLVRLVRWWFSCMALTWVTTSCADEGWKLRSSSAVRVVWWWKRAVVNAEGVEIVMAGVGWMMEEEDEGWLDITRTFDVSSWMWCKLRFHLIWIGKWNIKPMTHPEFWGTDLGIASPNPEGWDTISGTIVDEYVALFTHIVFWSISAASIMQSNAHSWNRVFRPFIPAS